MSDTAAAAMMTTTRACFGDTAIVRLGMGCWAIGGPFHSGGTPLGYAATDDDESIRAVHAAVGAGIRFFYTAAVYGAGHSERLLGRALHGRDDVFIATKIGFRFDETRREVLGEACEPDDVGPAIDASLRRLGRDHVDLLLLHLNSFPVDAALAVFDEIDRAVDAGKVSAYGWSTDFADRAAAVAARPHLAAIEHSANVLYSAPDMFPVVERHGLLALNRSPLAMGLLTGKFPAGRRVVGDDDVRSNDFDWMDWFKDGQAASRPAAQLDSIRDSLQHGGRTLAQGALAWLWARSPNALPIPGFRTVIQVEENTAALQLGPLPPFVMAEIETLIDRTDEHEPRER